MAGRGGGGEGVGLYLRLSALWQFGEGGVEGGKRGEGRGRRREEGGGGGDEMEREKH